MSPGLSESGDGAGGAERGAPGEDGSSEDLASLAPPTASSQVSHRRVGHGTGPGTLAGSMIIMIILQ